MVSVWVDSHNFRRYMENLECMGWSYHSRFYNIQILIPEKRIKRYESNGEAGIQFVII